VHQPEKSNQSEGHRNHTPYHTGMEQGEDLNSASRREVAVSFNFQGCDEPSCASLLVRWFQTGSDRIRIGLSFLLIEVLLELLDPCRGAKWRSHGARNG
jgi:hypothetical protein